MNHIKIYSLNIKNKIIIDETFNDLQRQNKFEYIIKFTLFDYFILLYKRRYLTINIKIKL